MVPGNLEKSQACARQANEAFFTGDRLKRDEWNSEQWGE